MLKVEVEEMYRSRSPFFKRHQSFGMQSHEDSMLKKERNKNRILTIYLTGERMFVDKNSKKVQTEDKYVVWL